METFILDNAVAVRLGSFAGVLGVMILWESLAPKRALGESKAVRWSANLGIVAINAVMLRFIAPAGAVGLAVVAEARGWGLLNNIAAPDVLAFAGALVALDLAIYLQHVLFHAVPALWRLHRMHHSDLDFDATTGIRFHPIEIALSMGIKMGVVAALGPPAVAVLIFEVVLNATAMFNHGNVRIAAGLDRVLRWFVVTPDMHRVHHSIIAHETNSNFGFNLPWWDRLLGTYRAAPAEGHQGMTIGIAQFRTARDLWLDRMLVQPFRGKAGDYPINRPGEGS